MGDVVGVLSGVGPRLGGDVDGLFVGNGVNGGNVQEGLGVGEVGVLFGDFVGLFVDVFIRKGIKV